jgi:AbrB family looped-hinge helix DNA binding protein
MVTTIDRAGRIVIPKAVRTEAGLEAGSEVEIDFRDGKIEIEPRSAAMRLVETVDGVRVEADRDLPPLTSAEVRSVLERVRR